MQETLNSLPLKDAAMFYARNGWPVFPLAGKVPYEGTHGHKDASTQETVIAAMWREHPKANIGLATGKVSGVMVVDMDVPEGYYNIRDLQKKYTHLPETRRSRTANGGMHFFYHYPSDGRRFPGTVGLSGFIGVDVRAEGNYVVLPPSRLFGRNYYTWANEDSEISQAPMWLLNLLTQAEEQRHMFQQSLGFAYQAGEKWYSEAISKATEGNRNTVGFWLARMLRNDGFTIEQTTRILLLFANRVPQEKSPYTSKESLASVESAYRRPPQERPRRL